MSDTKVFYKGHEVWCYGIVSVESNISVVCSDEIEDGILLVGFQTWTKAVKFIIDSGLFESKIEQLESI